MKVSSAQRFLSRCAIPAQWLGTDATYDRGGQIDQRRWEPSSLYGYGAQSVWTLAPADTVLGEYTLHAGQEQMLGRFDMVKPNPYVSRQQCCVRVSADGTCSVISLGKAQTYVITESERAPPGEMIDHTIFMGQDRAQVLRTLVLRTGQEHILQDRDQIVFRTAKFTAYAQWAGNDQQYSQDGWLMGVDDASGQTYHYHPQTNQFQWEPPQGANMPPVPGWLTGIDEASGQTYYYHEQTGHYQWDPPQLESVPPTSGWIAGIDEASGQTYYYHEHTGEYQWERPSSA